MIEELIGRIKKLEDELANYQSREHKHPILNLGTPTELTIAGGIVTRTQSNHIIDTEYDDPSDNLDTIKGGVEGDIILIRPANDARTVVCKNGTGNLHLPADMTLDDTDDVEFLYFDGTNWLEITASSNA